MYKATEGKPLATTITGSLPRPAWFVENLRGRPFLSAFHGDAAYREQYGDAVATLIADQVRAGLDIVSDGEMRFDMDVGGRSWFGYPFDRMTGLAAPERGARRERKGFAGRSREPADILSEFIDTMLAPHVVGPLGAGTLQYDAVWKVAQRLTGKPVKLGSCSGQMLDRQAVNRFYKDRRESVMAFSAALNAEYHRLADAGCAVIQLEEPCLHNAAATEPEAPLELYVEAFNREVSGLRQKTEVWCHTCWGNPYAQRLHGHPSYRPALEYFERLDADVVTFETAENGGAELAEIAAAIGKHQKLCIGVISHRTLQVELPDEVAALIRKALKHIEPGRLVLSSDCGFGRQGMSRTHAFYKMAAMVRGANIVRRELGLPEAPVPASDTRYGLG
jgi:5-methyltetrahydropteroyltriglutamate--homocysteine methyltransferase